MGEGQGDGRAELSLLRAHLDAIDRDILQLLSRRMAVVGEIAALKREHRIPVRDLERERDVLRERRRRAETLGLSPSIIESVFRLVLLGSRERQASLRAEVPVGEEPRTVAVIGGHGQMGRVLGELFADLGHAVLLVDLDTEVTPEQAAARADVVVVSVPIDATLEVIRRLGPLVREDALLMDVTSVKEAPVRAMLAASRASVVGTHPLFGPGIHSFQGQRIVVCPARGEAWAAWLDRTLRARGLAVTEATPERHDRAMGVVQVLTHLHTQALGLALARLGLPVEEPLSFTSPAYLLESYVTARHFAQSPELYGPIEMENPRTPDVVRALQEATEEIGAVLLAKDRDGFRAIFEEVRRFYGPFTDEALEQSGFLIDRLVELGAGR